MKTKISKNKFYLASILFVLSITLPLLHAEDIYFKEAPKVIIDDKSAYFGSTTIFIFNETEYSLKLDFEDRNKNLHSITVRGRGQATLQSDFTDNKLAFQDSDFYLEMLNKRINKESDFKKRDKLTLHWTNNKYEKEVWFDPMTSESDEFVVIELAFEFESDHEIKLVITKEGEQNKPVY